MNGIAEINRGSRRIQLTDEDECIFRFSLNRSNTEEYEAGISDRNDAAIMLARTALSMAGCRATCKRVMPA